MKKWIQSHRWTLVLFLMGVLYLVTHLVSLTALPVFADEAIYIRWSQLIMTDWRQYLFFPLNDGKTPLFIWSMIPFLQVTQDPLIAGRLFAVLVGLLQMYVVRLIIQLSGGNRFSQILGMLGVIFLPFWYFHHRLALMDGLLTLFLSLTLYGLIKIGQESVNIQHLSSNLTTIKSLFKQKYFSLWMWVVITGVCYGLAFLTKLPAVFFATVFPLFIFYSPNKKELISSMIVKAFPIGIAGVIGITIFLSLKIHPAFGQLFARGGDFTYSFSEVIALQGSSVIRNVLWIIEWLAVYQTYIFLLIALISPCILKQKRTVIIILLAGLFFIAPFAILGKTIAPRYLLPVATSFTVLFALSVEHLWNSKSNINKIICMTVIILLTAHSSQFLSTSISNPDRISLPWVDRQQYIEEWSSGHGILETVAYIEQRAKDQRVLILTEGYFGTLPDALLMYFYNRNVDNIAIIGIGQPIYSIPLEIQTKFSAYDTILLVVNSHRMFMNSDDQLQVELLEQYSRTPEAPTLQLYEIHD